MVWFRQQAMEAIYELTSPRPPSIKSVLCDQKHTFMLCAHASLIRINNVQAYTSTDTAYMHIMFTYIKDQNLFAYIMVYSCVQLLDTKPFLPRTQNVKLLLLIFKKQQIFTFILAVTSSVNARLHIVYIYTS